MIFVVLAMGRTFFSFFPYRIRPVSPSSRTAAWAFKFSGSVFTFDCTTADFSVSPFSDRITGTTGSCAVCCPLLSLYK